MQKFHFLIQARLTEEQTRTFITLFLYTLDTVRSNNGLFEISLPKLRRKAKIKNDKILPILKKLSRTRIHYQTVLSLEDQSKPAKTALLLEHFELSKSSASFKLNYNLEKLLRTDGEAFARFYNSLEGSTK